ncbi:MAG TPA: penicillin acylase family protein [Actinomycetes bacterium]|jgi:acyl-homoserine lactone acylase PvdQ|nr:penicillin acylase family protein [Actinomycetes bacterium]
MRRTTVGVLVLLLLPLAAMAPGKAATSHAGRHAPPGVERDRLGIAHVRASTPHDLYFLQGWVHAEDRLFQMDVSRRQASGTLAELLGPGALDSDVQLRAIGLRRAAERSLAVVSPRGAEALEAYAEGVNAFVAAHPLPPEYAALHLTRFAPWTPVDSLVVGKLIAFGLSFDLDIGLTEQLAAYQAAGARAGFDGSKLFSEDLMRSEPFTAASTSSRVPALAQAVGRATSVQGSNEWGVAGRSTVDGRPLVANDPHLALDQPSTFYPIHLQAGPTDVIGSGFAGIPGVIVGHNRFISWGATTNPMDVTDTFLEQVRPDASSPSGLATVFQGQLEPVQAVPEVFRQNNPTSGEPDDVTVVPPGGAVPAVTLIVPRRNNGPIIQLDLAHGRALSVQYTGFSATREIETFLTWDDARGLDDFQKGLETFDFGSQNWAYSDVHGNLAYFTSFVVGALHRAEGSGDPELTALARDPDVVEAVRRLDRWDSTTPTGIPEGYDAADVDGRRLPPNPHEIESSVAATIYAVWRARIVHDVIDARVDELGIPRPDGDRALGAIKHLLETFDSTQGVGASGIDFFQVPGVASAADRRDVLLLRALREALDKLAGPDFAAAFHGSRDQDDYRWGRLHRVVLDHPLGGQFSVPPGFGRFPPPLADLPGIPTDGGFSTVDAASHSVRAGNAGSFTFGGGPANRYVSATGRRGVTAQSSLPGGTSALPTSPFYLNLLPMWLTDDSFPLNL